MFYYAPGSGKMHGQRVTILDRLRMKKARKKRGREWRLFCGQ